MLILSFSPSSDAQRAQQRRVHPRHRHAVDSSGLGTQAALFQRPDLFAEHQRVAFQPASRALTHACVGRSLLPTREVIAAQITVGENRLPRSFWITSTGRTPPCSLPLHRVQIRDKDIAACDLHALHPNGKKNHGASPAFSLCPAFARVIGCAAPRIRPTRSRPRAEPRLRRFARAPVIARPRAASHAHALRQQRRIVPVSTSPQPPVPMPSQPVTFHRHVLAVRDHRRRALEQHACVHIGGSCCASSTGASRTACTVVPHSRAISRPDAGSAPYSRLRRRRIWPADTARPRPRPSGYRPNQRLNRQPRAPSRPSPGPMASAALPLANSASYPPRPRRAPRRRQPPSPSRRAPALRTVPSAANGQVAVTSPAPARSADARKTPPPGHPSLPATLEHMAERAPVSVGGANRQQGACVRFLQHVDSLRAVPFGQNPDIRDGQLPRIRAPRIEQQPMLGAVKRHRPPARAPRRRAPAPSRRPRRREYPPRRRQAALLIRRTAESAAPSSSRLSPVPYSASTIAAQSPAPPALRCKAR